MSETVCWLKLSRLKAKEPVGGLTAVNRLKCRIAPRASRLLIAIWSAKAALLFRSPGPEIPFRSRLVPRAAVSRAAPARRVRHRIFRVSG